MQDHNLEADRLLIAHGYTPLKMSAFELIGERRYKGMIEDVDAVIFASGLSAAIKKYMTRIKGTTENIIEAYNLGDMPRNYIISMIHKDPSLQGKFSFIMEKGLIIGPGGDRADYQATARSRRYPISIDVVRRSLDKVLVEIQRGVSRP